MTFEEAVALARADCKKECRALLCERDNRCYALLYDTPGFYKQVLAKIGKEETQINGQ